VSVSCETSALNVTAFYSGVDVMQSLVKEVRRFGMDSVSDSWRAR
jgi:hypothetical protein